MRGIPDYRKFTRRPLSWITEDENCFYKIPRGSESVESDMVDPECISEAGKEYELSNFLGCVDESINKPMRVEQACIISPMMSGPDMIDFIRKLKDGAAIQDCIETSIRLLGRLHLASVDISGFPIHDYGRDSFLAATAELAESISAKRRTVVIDGFEVRNFRYDKIRNKWLFFDPHNIRQGIPEEDISRFIVSLLMLNWGRAFKFRIWTGFCARSLLKVYKNESSVKIDGQLLKYSFELILNMRRYYALKSVRDMSYFKRIVARMYLEIYFRQMHRWVNRNDITVR